MKVGNILLPFFLFEFIFLFHPPLSFLYELLDVCLNTLGLKFLGPKEKVKKKNFWTVNAGLCFCITRSSFLIVF